MGINTNLYKDGKLIAGLGRTHNYQSEFETEEELIIYMLTVVMKYLKVDTRDIGSAVYATGEIEDGIRYAIEEATKRGRQEVLSEMEEGGIEVRHE